MVNFTITTIHGEKDCRPANVVILMCIAVTIFVIIMERTFSLEKIGILMVQVAPAITDLPSTVMIMATDPIPVDTAATSIHWVTHGCMKVVVAHAGMVTASTVTMNY